MKLHDLVVEVTRATIVYIDGAGTHIWEVCKANSI